MMQTRSKGNIVRKESGHKGKEFYWIGLSMMLDEEKLDKRANCKDRSLVCYRHKRGLILCNLRWATASVNHPVMAGL